MVVRRGLVTALLVVVGCSDDTPTSPTADSLDGVWRIISIQPATQPVEIAPVGAQYQIGFQDRRAFVRVDCNTCTGPFAVNGNTLTIGPTLTCTLAACATASYATTVVDMLSGAHEMATTLHNLTLTSSRGSILLQR